jgi:hypothetical protein
MNSLIKPVIFSTAAILIAGLGTVSVGWYFSRSRPVEHTQDSTVVKLPEGIDIVWKCNGVFIAMVEDQLKGVSRGGTYIEDDVERTVWIYNPPQLPPGTPLVFKQYETAHPYSTWSAKLNDQDCETYFWVDEDFPQKMLKIIRLEKSDEFKQCFKENPDEYVMCRDVAEEELK